jgi:tRNA pseudouridine55 synthase
VSEQQPVGLLVVDKPAGMTSHDVVARVRRLAGTRKVGHAGTLDPMATGVLVVGVGKATRLLGHLTLTEKGYDATIRLGEATTTDDAEGERLSTASAREVSIDDVRAAAKEFVGDIEQQPAAVSAVKVGGVRSYTRVRAGEQVDLPARPVTVHDLAVRQARPVGEHLDVDVSLRCSSGTYVRAIARDLGRALRVGGPQTALRRTAVGPFALVDAHPLADLDPATAMLSLTEVARRCFPVHALTPEQEQAVAHGRPLDLDLRHSGPVAVLSGDGSFLALYEKRDALARPVAVFV